MVTNVDASGVEVDQDVEHAEFWCEPCSLGASWPGGTLQMSDLSKAGMLANVDFSGVEVDAYSCPFTNNYVWEEAFDVQEPENEPDTLLDVQPAETSMCARTKLKTDAPAFEPKQYDARFEAIASCLRIALVSCGQIQDIKVEAGLAGMSSLMIFAELHSGPRAAARSYDVMQLTKQALDAITGRLPTTTLLSSRVQKEDCGYSLRSSIACSPNDAQGSICWDMFRKGYCPRRGQCRWYHPQDGDIVRVKVCIRYTEDVCEVLGEEQLGADSSAARHKISIGEVVHYQ